MTEKVLLLEGEDGKLFSITPELLRLAEVLDENKKITLRARAEAPSTPTDLLGIKVHGTVPRSEFPWIRGEFIEPAINALTKPSAMDP